MSYDNTGAPVRVPLGRAVEVAELAAVVVAGESKHGASDLCLHMCIYIYMYIYVCIHIGREREREEGRERGREREGDACMCA